MDLDRGVFVLVDIWPRQLTRWWTRIWAWKETDKVANNEREKVVRKLTSKLLDKVLDQTHTHLTRFDALLVTCVIGQLRHRQTNYSVNEKCPVMIDFLHYLQVRFRLSEDSFHPLIYFEYEYVKRICTCL